MLNTIIQKSSSFVVRLQDNAAYEIIEEHALSETDRQAGIEFDRTVWLGCKQKRNNISKPLRVIQIHYYDERAFYGHKRKSRVSSKKTFRTRSSERTLLIVTDLMDLTAELIALIYRYRWQIELFPTFVRTSFSLVQMHPGLSASAGAFPEWDYHPGLLRLDCQSVNQDMDRPQTD